jgi:DNA-binding response OmpR family regulator
LPTRPEAGKVVTVAKVLLVEDEVAIADAVQYALRAEGLQVEHSLLGAPALERLRREHLARRKIILTRSRRRC